MLDSGASPSPLLGGQTLRVRAPAEVPLSWLETSRHAVSMSDDQPNIVYLRGKAGQPVPAGPQPAPPGAGAPDPPPRPKLKKLRLALILLGLGALAVVSTIFGMMMAVASD